MPPPGVKRIGTQFADLTGRLARQPLAIASGQGSGAQTGGQAMDRMLRCRVREAESDALQGLLFLAGAEGFERRDATVAPLPVGEVELITYGEVEALERLRAAAEGFEGLLAPPELSAAPKVDWAEAWKVHFKPLRISPRLVVAPSWESVEVEEGLRVISVDPGSAFGTGQHATTALCLRALDQLAAEGGIGRFADIGCGTGILAIGASLMGGESPWLTENDPLALDVAQENLEALGMADQVTMTCCERPTSERRFDTVVANILAPVLIDLADELVALVAPGGQLLLSGLLVSQIDEVEAPFLARGMSRWRLNTEGEWALLWLRP